jgi:hypothetical protein
MQNASRVRPGAWILAVLAGALAGCNGTQTEQTGQPELQEPSGLSWTHGSGQVEDRMQEFVEVRRVQHGQAVDAVKIVLPDDQRIDEVTEVDLGPVRAVRIDARHTGQNSGLRVLRIVAAGPDEVLRTALEATSSRPFEIRDTDEDGTAEVVTYDQQQAIVYRFENGLFRRDTDGS